ncbi:hypothetical protein AHAS_Ahas02G0037400 [Arachis hypogaea]
MKRPGTPQILDLDRKNQITISFSNHKRRGKGSSSDETEHPHSLAPGETVTDPAHGSYARNGPRTRLPRSNPLRPSRRPGTGPLEFLTNFRIQTSLLS